MDRPSANERPGTDREVRGPVSRPPFGSRGDISLLWVPLSPQVIDLAVERSAFGAMRSEEEKRGAEAYLLLGGAAYREGPGRFYRRDGSMVGK